MSSSDRSISVFKTDDAALMPLATLALEEAGIEYAVRHSGKDDSLEWMGSQSPTTVPQVLEIVVTPDVASRARDLLMDLASASSAALAPTIDPISAPDPPGIVVEDAVSGVALGALSEAHLQDLISRLQEQEEAPQQYRITPDALDDLGKGGMDADLIAILRAASPNADGDLVIRWSVR